MTPEEFEKAIKNGLGRIIVYLQHHDATPYREIIRDACLNCTSNDPQIEGTHSDYLFDIINLTDDKDYYRDDILNALAEAQDQGWGMIHLMDMAKFFAMAGDNGARQAMYDKFAAELENDYWVGGSSIIEATGMEGFLFIADKLGQFAMDDEEFDDTDLYLWCLQNLEPPIPEEKIEAVLTQARAENPRIDAYLKVVERYKSQRQDDSESSKHPSELTYTELKIAIDQHSQVSEQALRDARHWGRKATEEDLKAAAHDVLNENDARKLMSYLAIFSWAKFPLDPAKIIPLAMHDNHWLAVSAMNALENLSHPEIRAIALRMIEQGLRVGRAVGLLQRNFEVDDWQLLEKLTATEFDKDTYHDLSMSIRHVFELNPDVKGVSTLMNVYENLPCGICRNDVVELAHMVGALPAEIAEECKYDSYEFMREAARAGFKDAGRRRNFGI